MMSRVLELLPFLVLGLFLGIVAADPDMLQDVCVADLSSAVKVNGFPCKATFNASDFSTDVIAKPGPTNNTMGSLVTGANVGTKEVEKIKSRLAPKK
ncbi:hypothetical protein MLD38_016818 [Melastoma candidum]|uniref:Uncharacterized protein n=1 Tax=Melastoma candidum TaxID=119954 RepID=A0ACB9QRR6_9MYRT|nr:hypothetical protein MLD38_016818 [Melastoma candidum]